MTRPSRRMPVFLLICGLALSARADEIKIYAVRTADAALADAVREDGFFRWIAPQLDGVEARVGPEAEGDLVVLAATLPASEEIVRRLDGVPLRFGEDGSIVFDGTVYRRARHTLALRLPGDKPVTWVVVGRERERVAGLANSVLAEASGRSWPRREPFDFWLFESHYLSRLGRWREPDRAEIAGAKTKVTIDRASEKDGIAERDRDWSAKTPIAGELVVLRVPPERRTDPALGALARELDGAAAAMAKRVPIQLERPLEVVVESDYVTLGRYLGIVEPAVATGVDDAAAGDVHLVYHPGDLDAYRFAVAGALVRRAGLELPPWLADGAALWLSEGWYGRSYGDYLPSLAASDALPSATELLAGERQRDGSRVIWAPAAAAVVGELRGDDLRRKLATVPGAPAVTGILRRLTDRLAELPSPEPMARGTSADGFLRGVSQAMNPSNASAYHGEGVDATLERFAELGADAVAVMPFAFQRAPDQPEIRYVQGQPKDETDAGLVHAARRARAAGFRVLWKPHVYVWNDSWPGEISMGSEEDWRVWWRSYRRYVLHQAILARFAGAELFAVGTELGKTIERETEWRQLIAGVRRLYPGALTYAGNWWGDYDRAPFWDALDYVGVDAYFPLAGDASADRAALEKGARDAVAKIAAVAREEGKKVIFTELGYAARQGAWVAPHEEGGELSLAHQKLAYEVFLDALGRPDWLAGVFLWKAYSHPDVDDGGDQPDFRFLARPAEEVIRSYFKKLDRRRFDG